MYKIGLLLFLGVFLFACNDDSSDSPCGIYGTYDELTESCNCDSFYEGDNCAIEARSKYIGTWTTTSSNCTDQNGDELLPIWTIESLDNIDGIVIQSQIVFSNMALEAGLSTDTTAELLAVGSILGNINFVNDSSLIFNLSTNEECTFELSR